MNQHVEVQHAELNPTGEQTITGVVFAVRNCPRFVNPILGDFSPEKVAVLQVNCERLQPPVFVCLPRLSRVPNESILISNDDSMDSLQIAVPLPIEDGKIAYFNVDFQGNKLIRTGISGNIFETKEHSRTWIAHLEQGFVAQAPGLEWGYEMAAYFLTPGITQTFPQSHRREAQWYATSVAKCGCNPLALPEGAASPEVLHLASMRKTRFRSK